MNFKIFVLTVAFGLNCLSPGAACAAAATSDALTYSTDPYVTLMGQYNTQLDAAAAAYKACAPTALSCQYVNLSKKNMIAASIRSATEGRTLNSDNTSGAFKYLFDGFHTRIGNIQKDLAACKGTAATCSEIARAKQDRVHADELLARRAFDSYAQVELARLQGGCTVTANTGIGNDAFATTAAMTTNASTKVTAMPMVSVGSGN